MAQATHPVSPIWAPDSPQLFFSCPSSFPSVPEPLAVPSGSWGRAETSLRAEEYDCPKGPPSSPIEDSLGPLLQPAFPESFSGAWGQHVSDLLPAYTDHTVGRELLGRVLCASLDLCFPISTKKEWDQPREDNGDRPSSAHPIYQAALTWSTRLGKGVRPGNPGCSVAQAGQETDYLTSRTSIPDLAQPTFPRTELGARNNPMAGSGQ